MRLPESIRDNLRFLIVEVGSQVANLRAHLDTSSTIVARRILDRSGYAYNLKMRIHDSCLTQIARGKESSDAQSLRAAESISSDLDRIAELCRDCIHQTQYFTKKRWLRPADYRPLLNKVNGGIELIESAINGNDTEIALKIGGIEHKLDRGYRRLLKRYTQALKKKTHTEDLISALFVAHRVEQMGDSLLNISEAIISANLGQPINIDRYHSLKQVVAQLESSDKKLSRLAIEPVAETRSGSAIAGISSPAQKDEGYIAIFKDGKKRKLKEERAGVEAWHEIFPGLAPKILSYHKQGQSAALLIEHLAGLTFEQMLLHEPNALLMEALEQLSRTLKSVWRETRSKQRIAADYMGQLAKRLPDVYAIHPEFEQAESQVCGVDLPSYSQLMEQARAYEKGLRAPFSVYIHGDFNVDNIIYDPVEKRINFIDLHRSRYMDYVQDISVFMVSNYRLQVLDKPVRLRIVELVNKFYRFARRYAEKVEDHTFELRLALGLARSFASSTRFILDKSLAQDMFLRSRYLIERVLETDQAKSSGFRVPIKTIFSG